jgi:hypothetical protein
LGHVKEPSSCSSLRAAGKIRMFSFLPSLIEVSRAAWFGVPLEMKEGTIPIWGTKGLSTRPRGITLMTTHLNYTPLSHYYLAFTLVIHFSRSHWPYRNFQIDSFGFSLTAAILLKVTLRNWRAAGRFCPLKSLLKLLTTILEGGFFISS